MTSRPVLLVEDNPDDQVLTLRALRKNNIINEVAVVGDGAEALKLLLPDDGASGMLPGLILLDLKLPKVDGLEVLRRLRADQRTRIVPVVVLTSSKPKFRAPSASGGDCPAIMTWSEARRRLPV